MGRNVMLELRLEGCGDRETDVIKETGEVRVLCNSNGVYCEHRGETIKYKGRFRRTCSYNYK